MPGGLVPNTGFSSHELGSVQCLPAQRREAPGPTAASNIVAAQTIQDVSKDVAWAAARGGATEDTSCAHSAATDEIVRGVPDGAEPMVARAISDSDGDALKAAAAELQEHAAHLASEGALAAPAAFQLESATVPATATPL